MVSVAAGPVASEVSAFCADFQILLRVRSWWTVAHKDYLHSAAYSTIDWTALALLSVWRLQTACLSGPHLTGAALCMTGLAPQLA